MKTQITAIAFMLTVTACSQTGFESASGQSGKNESVTGTPIVAGTVGSNSSGSSVLPPSNQVSANQTQSTSESAIQRDSEVPTCAVLAGEVNRITGILTAYYASDDAYNKFANAMALAGGAPKTYISPNVSPGITQGPGVTDQVNKITVLRSDLYYAHDAAAKVRQSLRDFQEPVLDPIYAGNSTVESKFRDYVSKIKALPLFAGPPGLQLAGYSQHLMSMLDANALETQLAAWNAKSCR